MSSLILTLKELANAKGLKFGLDHLIFFEVGFHASDLFSVPV